MWNILSEKSSKAAIAVGAILFFLAILSLLVFQIPGTPGVFGDFIGGVVGSIWALAGVILFYLALKSQQAALSDQKAATKATIEAVNKQSEALELQMKEFELQRKELEDTRKVFQNQSQTLDIQRFENTFFNLITLHKSIIQNARINATNKEQVGSFAFSHLWNEFRHTTMRQDDRINLLSVANRFAEYTIKFDHVFGPYLSTISNTLHLLDQLDVPNKSYYMRIYRAQLSHLDKTLLFYTGAHGGDGNTLKPLIEKYHLLHMLDTQSLINPTDWKAYNQEAFIK